MSLLGRFSVQTMLRKQKEIQIQRDTEIREAPIIPDTMVAAFY